MLHNIKIFFHLVYIESTIRISDLKFVQNKDCQYRVIHRYQCKIESSDKISLNFITKERQYELSVITK